MWKAGFHSNGIQLYSQKCYDLSRVNGFIFSKRDTEYIAEFYEDVKHFRMMSLFVPQIKKNV